MSSKDIELSFKPTVTDCPKIKVGPLEIGGDAPLALLAGPCVMESESHILMMAEKLKELTLRMGIPFIFKASFDKANRTSIHSYRGPGLEKGLSIFRRVKQEFDLPVVTDVHESYQAEACGEVCDLLQIPAFLCRQTDLLVAAAKTGRAVNVKKAQFLSPSDMKNVVEKLRDSGCHDIMLTERGTSFGYGTLVSDFRGLPTMQKMCGVPVCFDGTHSVQEPGGLGTTSGGKREHVPTLCRAACAVGVNALFIETHDDPSQAKSDGPNMVPLNKLEALLAGCLAIDKVVRSFQ